MLRERKDFIKYVFIKIIKIIKTRFDNITNKI